MPGRFEKLHHAAQNRLVLTDDSGRNQIGRLSGFFGLFLLTASFSFLDNRRARVNRLSSQSQIVKAGSRIGDALQCCLTDRSA